MPIAAFNPGLPAPLVITRRSAPTINSTMLGIISLNAQF